MAFAILALSRALAYRGTPRVARVAMIITTISNSMIVNPRDRSFGLKRQSSPLCRMPRRKGENRSIIAATDL